MRSLLSCCVLLVLVAPVSGEEAFRPLFDGETLDGWVQRGGKAVYEVDAEAEGGPQIVGTSVVDTPNSFLCTDRDYGDFVLEFEVKVDSSLNSGVQFRSLFFKEATTAEVPTADGGTRKIGIQPWRVHGYQVEIDPSPRAFSGGVYDEGRRGWILKPEGDDYAEARAAFKPGEWNHYRVEAIGPSLRTFINGVAVADFEDTVTPSGFIALQVHSIGSPEQAGKKVRWRSVRISER